MLMLLMSTIDQSMFGIPILHTAQSVQHRKCMTSHMFLHWHASSVTLTHPSLRSIAPRGRMKNARCASSEKANAEPMQELAPVTASVYQYATHYQIARDLGEEACDLTSGR